MRRMIRMLSLLLLLAVLTPAAAQADDVYIVKDASAVSSVTTGCAYLQVRCLLEGETNVVLSVHDEWGSLIYQRNYGCCSGSFSSKDIYLPLSGESTDYTVTLSMDAGEYVFTVTREQPMLTDTAVYAGGLTLEEMIGGSRYKSALVLDVYELEGQVVAAPMLADGMEIGTVFFSVLDGKLTVQYELCVQGNVDKANVYLATDAITARTFGTNRFTGVKTKLGREISLGGAPYAAVMVQFTVTYDPEGAQAFRMGKEEEEAYLELLENWQLMQLMTANEAVG